MEDFKEARQTQERERQFMVSQIYLHKRLRLIPQGFEIFLLDPPLSESVEVFHFVQFTGGSQVDIAVYLLYFLSFYPGRRLRVIPHFFQG